MVASIIGEGGSGGAIALATGNRVVMFEHAIYSVISPEGCASILWRSSDHAKEAAEALRITSAHMKELGVVDAIVPEPLGGAHRDQTAAIASLGDACFAQLRDLQQMDRDALIADRAAKYLAMGES
jgi:acetyl-CoA carboxylase carboxyl transferase subunit alpha